MHDEITPCPESSDDLHDLLCSLVMTKPRPEWTELWNELVARGRAQVLESGSGDLWCAAETLDDARRAFADDDNAVVAVVRGQLELAGITTTERLAAACALPTGRVAYGLAVLEREGVALQGAYTDPDAGIEWVARRLLARMHAYSRRSRRGRTEPATAQDFMRFLLRWQHLAPGTQLFGDEGLATVVGQLQGWEAAAAAWEPELLARRLRRHDAATLDRLCHDGEIGWLRLSPRPRDVDAPAGAPNKATPISVLFRDDLHWLLEAARAGTDPLEPTTGATAEVVELLRERGACFATELGEATNRLPEDIERALWDGVSRGLLTSDGFGAIRARVDKGTRERVNRVDRTRLSRLIAAPGRVAHPPGGGRWCRQPARTSTAKSWPKPSPSCCSIVGVCCSATWPGASRSASRGAMCSALCGGSRTGGSCVADGSSPGARANNSRCRRPPNS